MEYAPGSKELQLHEAIRLDIGGLLMKSTLVPMDNVLAPGGYDLYIVSGESQAKGARRVVAVSSSPRDYDAHFYIATFKELWPGAALTGLFSCVPQHMLDLFENSLPLASTKRLAQLREATRQLKPLRLPEPQAGGLLETMAMVVRRAKRKVP